jgi:hypothetical protein
LLDAIQDAFEFFRRDGLIGQALIELFPGEIFPAFTLFDQFADGLIDCVDGDHGAIGHK